MENVPPAGRFLRKVEFACKLGQQFGFAIKIANLLRKPQIVASAKTFAEGKMGIAIAPSERWRKNNICSDFGVILRPSYGRSVTRKSYDAEKKASFLCRRVSFALTDNRDAVIRPKMTQSFRAPIQ